MCIQRSYRNKTHHNIHVSLFNYSVPCNNGHSWSVPLQPILGTSATISTQRRTRFGLIILSTPVPTGVTTTLRSGRSTLILSFASLIVQPTSSGHSVLGALHDLLSAGELIFTQQLSNTSSNSENLLNKRVDKRSYA